MLIDDLCGQISRKIAPCYFVVDPTRFFSDHIEAQIKKVFLGKATPDNHSTHYATQLNVNELLQDLNTVSMFSPKRMVVIKEADRILKDQSAAMLSFLKYSKKHQVKDYVLVFLANKKPRHELYKYCIRQKMVSEFKKQYDSKMPFWVHWIARKNRLTIEPRAVFLLIERVGTDLLRLNMEMEKLAIFIGPDRRDISEEDVKALLYSTRAHSVFELTGAIGHKRKLASLKLLEMMVEAGESEIFIFSMIVRHLRNLWKAVEWRGVKSDAEAQRAIGIHPMFWDDFRRQRDRYLNASFESYWKLALQTEKSLKTSTVHKPSLLSHFISEVC